MALISVYILNDKQEEVKVCDCICRKTFIPEDINEVLGTIERDIVQYDIQYIVPDSSSNNSNLTNNKDELYNIIRSNQFIVKEDGIECNIINQSIYKNNSLFWFKIRENTKNIL